MPRTEDETWEYVDWIADGDDDEEDSLAATARGLLLLCHRVQEIEGKMDELQNLLPQDDDDEAEA